MSVRPAKYPHTHHQNGTLNSLDTQVLLLAGHIVRAHNAALLAGSDRAREHTPEGVEAPLVRGGHHLGDVHHQHAVGVAALHAEEGLVVVGALVQHLGTVLLGRDRRRQVDADHGQQSVAGWQPRLHDRLHQRLASRLDLVLVLGRDLDGQLLDELQVLLLSEVHDSREDLSHK